MGHPARKPVCHKWMDWTSWTRHSRGQKAHGRLVELPGNWLDLRAASGYSRPAATAHRRRIFSPGRF